MENESMHPSNTLAQMSRDLAGAMDTLNWQYHTMARLRSLLLTCEIESRPSTCAELRAIETANNQDERLAA
jgi:hypothetical protein